MSLATNAQTHSLPTIYIETQNKQDITSKTVYLPAKYYIIDKSNSSFNIGSASSPLPMEIRGRGHSSWKGSKKPYKIKLTDKAGLLGMVPHRHWALLKYYEPTVAGLELGKIIGMDWTASTKPVEVLLNGQYLGLYLLTETNRISINRLDIYEQSDLNEDMNTIPYGWLVEVDNYRETNQIGIKETSSWNLRITYHSPGVLSYAQEQWLINEFNEINKAIYDPDKEHSTWENKIDVDAMALFFIVQEVMDNSDGFHGSFYLHKDSVEGARWVAGPLWDLSCGERNKTDYTFRMRTSYSFTPHWIGELIKDDDFKLAVRAAWEEFYPSKVDSWMQYIDDNLLFLAEAFEKEKKLWEYVNQDSLELRVAKLKSSLRSNIEWFNDNLPKVSANSILDVHSGNGKIMKVEYINMAGMRSTKSWPGMNIIETTYDDGHIMTSKVINKN